MRNDSWLSMVKVSGESEGLNTLQRLKCTYIDTIVKKCYISDYRFRLFYFMNFSEKNYLAEIHQHLRHIQ